MTADIIKDTTKKRPVVVSLPPKKPVDSEHIVKHQQQHPEPHACACTCAIIGNKISNGSDGSGSGSESGSSSNSDPASILLLNQKRQGPNRIEFRQQPIAAWMPSSLSPDISSHNSEVKLEQPSINSVKSESEEQKKSFISPHGNLYNDPAVMHVIEHSKDYYDGHIRGLSTTHPPPPPPPPPPITQPGAVCEHPLQYGFHPVCAPYYCPDKIWGSLAKRIEQLIDVKIRSAFNPIHVAGNDNGVRLDGLELTVAQLDRRIFALEFPQQQQQQQQQQQRRRRQSMPAKADMATTAEDTISQAAAQDTDKMALQATVDNLKSMLQHQQHQHATSSTNSGSRGSSTRNNDCITRNDDSQMQQLQRECQELHARLAEEQRRSKQLELEHVDFHKRQIEDHIKMEKLRQQIHMLESELKKQHQQQQRSGRNSNSNNQHNHLAYREQKATHHHHQHHLHNNNTNHHNKLPTPGSSPLSCHPQYHSSNQEEESVREEDGYLIFNTNINGELIHCKVKIPTATTNVRSSSPARRGADLALVSPPMTRACSPRDMMPASSKKKSGLNPNAPEWKNGTWK